MLEELKDFEGKIIINGRNYTKETLPDLDSFDELDIYLEAKEETTQEVKKDTLYEITVKEDMTEYGKGQKNFHKNWNKGVAMPFRRMNGKILEELDSMYRVSLSKAGMSWTGYILKDFIDTIKEI